MINNTDDIAGMAMVYFTAKQVIELAGNQQTTFTDLVAQLGLASALRPDGEYTLLAPVNNAFSGRSWILSFLLSFPQATLTHLFSSP